MPRLNDDYLMGWKTEKHSVAISTDRCGVPRNYRDDLVTTVALNECLLTCDMIDWNLRMGAI